MPGRTHSPNSRASRSSSIRRRASALRRSCSSECDPYFSACFAGNGIDMRHRSQQTPNPVAFGNVVLRPIRPEPQGQGLNVELKTRRGLLLFAHLREQHLRSSAVGVPHSGHGCIHPPLSYCVVVGFRPPPMRVPSRAPEMRFDRQRTEDVNSAGTPAYSRPARERDTRARSGGGSKRVHRADQREQRNPGYCRNRDDGGIHD